MTPTQRSLTHLRSNGFTACVVEKWIPQIRRRKDAFNFADIIAVKVGQIGTTYVQTTSGSNVSSRVSKIQGTAEAGIVLASGNRIVVHGWRRVGARGKRKLWELREVEINPTAFETDNPSSDLNSTGAGQGMVSPMKV